MDFKELSVLRLSRRWLRPWSVICLQLLTSEQTHLKKVAYALNSKLMDCRTQRGLRPFPSEFIPSSEMQHLFISQIIYSRKVTCPETSRLRDCKELSVLRPSLRFMKPWFVGPQQLLSGQQIHFRKIAYSTKLRWRDCKELSVLKPSLRSLRPWSVSFSQLLLFKSTNSFSENHLLLKGKMEGL